MDRPPHQLLRVLPGAATGCPACGVVYVPADEWSYWCDWCDEARPEVCDSQTSPAVTGADARLPARACQIDAGAAIGLSDVWP